MKKEVTNVSKIHLLISKIQAVTKIMNSPDLYKTIGTEWHDDEESQGIKQKRIIGINKNRETSTVFIDAEKNSTVKAHYHEQTELLLCLKGEVFFPLQGITIKANETYLIKSKEIHEIHFKQDSELIINWSPCFSSKKEIKLRYPNKF